MNRKTIFSSFAVSNLEEAQQFYQDILGLQVSSEDNYLLQIKISDSHFVMVYVKPDHIPATFTILNFGVDDIEETVATLKQKGVTFESYKEEDFKTNEDNISRNEMVSVAWFKDPSGNILSVLQEK